MELIKLKLPSMFRKNKKISISMILVSTFGMLMMIVLTGFHASICCSVDRYYQEACIMPDVVYVLEHPVHVDSLPQIEGVSEQNGLFFMSTQGRSESGRRLSFTTVVDRGNSLWKDVTKEEKKSQTLVNVGISSELAERNHIQAGDSLFLDINGVSTEVCVGRIIVHISMFQMERNALYDTTEYGMLTIDRHDFQRLYPGTDNLVNGIQQNYTDAGNITQQAEQYQQLLVSGGMPVASKLECSDINFFKDILDPIYSMSLYVPLLFFLIMLIMIVIFLSVIVRNDRSQIGVLRAIGYSTKQIRRLYCVYTFVITSIASVICISLGALTVYLVMNLFCKGYGLTPYYMLDWRKCLYASLLTLLFGQMAAFLSVSATGRIQPSEALSGRNGEQKSLSLPAKKLLSGFGELRKLMFCASLRNKVRLLTTMLAIFMTGLLIIAALSVYVSREYIYENFQERFNFDTRAVFSVEITDDILEQIQSFEGVERCEPYHISHPVLAYGNEAFPVLLVGKSPDSELMKAEGLDGTWLRLPDDGVILSESDCKFLNCTVGDIVQVNGVSVEVSALSVESDSHTMQCSLQMYDRIMGTNGPDSVIIKTAQNSVKEENELADELSKIPGYEYSVYTRVQLHEMTYSYGAYSYGIIVILILGIMLGFVIVYNISVINVNDRMAEYGLLRAIGVQVRQISIASYAEIVVQYLFTMAAGILVSIPVMKLILNLLTIVRMKLYLRNDYRLYLLAAGIVFIYITIGHFASMKTVKQIDLVENVKTRE